MMLKINLIHLMIITFVIAGCTTDQQSTDVSLDQPLEHYSIDASLKGSFDGEWYISANNQFRIKLLELAPITHIQDDYDSGTKGTGVTFKSKDTSFISSIFSAPISESHNFDAVTSIYEKAYGENIEGDCIRKRTAISVSGERGITYLLGYVSREQHYVTKPSITSIFEKNGYFYQVILPSTESFGPESEDEQYKALERNMEKLLNNIEFIK